MSISSLFDSMASWAFPGLALRGTAWEAEWKSQEQASFLTIIRVASPLIAAFYVAHYFFYDVPMGLEPIQRWLAFRLTVASIWVATFLFYVSPLSRRDWYKTPALLATWATCISQAVAMLWYGQQAWIFGFIMLAGSVLLLRLPVIQSVVFVLLVAASQARIYLDAGLSWPDIVTGTLVVLGIAVILRSSHSNDIRYYILNKQNARAQEEIAQLNSDMAQRIQAFIPRIIANRMSYAIEVERRTVVEASINVLEPTKKQIACLHSDIRGYTQNSKSLEDFVYKSVIPEVKACSEAIERYQGVPRKIGDLVFAYFDSNDIEKNILFALLAAFDIAQLNKDINETFATVDIRRYVLIDAGDAIVGNIGGLDSSIEITALGPPVNFLSRLDEATKAPALAARLSHGDILMSQDCALLSSTIRGLEHETLDLSEMGIQIRDYPNTHRIVRILPNQANVQMLREGASTSSTAVRDEYRATQLA